MRPMGDFSTFVDDYYTRFIDALRSFDREPLHAVLGVVDAVVAREGTLWVAGNGGSAAIADHTVCDATKWTYVKGRAPFRTVSLTSNVAMLTALANDIRYDQVFRQQLEYYLKPDDAVLLISASGNSPNVVEACRYANERGVPTIAFVGFDGGELKALARHVVWVPTANYGMVEDTHQSLMHCITQFMKARAEST